ncbi:hypothetical protein D3C79_920360 [compost metagenome]
MVTTLSTELVKLESVTNPPSLRAISSILKVASATLFTLNFNSDVRMNFLPLSFPVSAADEDIIAVSAEAIDSISALWF